MVFEGVKAKLKEIQTTQENKLQREKDFVKLASGGKLIPGSVLSRKKASLNRKEQLLVLTRRALTRLGIKEENRNATPKG